MISGVVLAGGDHSRMDYVNRALLPFNGKLVLERQVEEMRKLCSEVIVVVNEPRDYLPLFAGKARIITDYETGKGPLGGLHAALSLCKENHAWVVGCDQPFISQEAASCLFAYALKTEADVTLPVVEGNRLYLHALYHRRCVPHMHAMIREGRLGWQEAVQGLRVFEVLESAFTERGISRHFGQAFKTLDEYLHALTIEPAE